MIEQLQPPGRLRAQKLPPITHLPAAIRRNHARTTPRPFAHVTGPTTLIRSVLRPKNLPPFTVIVEHERAPAAAARSATPPAVSSPATSTLATSTRLDSIPASLH